MSINIVENGVLKNVSGGGKFGTMGTVPDGTNLNYIITPGSYWLNHNYSYINIPTSISNGIMLVYKEVSTCKQIILRRGTFNANDDNTFVRSLYVVNGKTQDASNWVKYLTERDWNAIEDTYARKDHIVNSSAVTETGFIADARLLNPNNADSPVNPAKIAENFTGPSNNAWSKVNIETWYPGASLFNSADGLCCREKKDGTRMINGLFKYDPNAEGAGLKICDVPSAFSFDISKMQAWIPAITRTDSGITETKWIRFFGARLEWWPTKPSANLSFLVYFIY